MRRVKYCVNHTKYVVGCNDCLVQARIYRLDYGNRTEDTHYKNGIRKRQGIYSDVNWARFNALGKRLTNGHLNRSVGGGGV